MVINDKISNTIEYYSFQSDKIKEIINAKNALTVEEIIAYGERLSELEHKITALEAANEA